MGTLLQQFNLYTSARGLDMIMLFDGKLADQVLEVMLEIPNST